MRVAAGLLLSALLSALVAAPAVAQSEREVRAFAVAWRHEVAQVESYKSFRAAVREQFDERIAPHLATDRPNLVTYPEDQGLMAYLVGSRGGASRELLQQAGAEAGIASLAGPYAPQMAYYEAKFPDVDSPGQLLLLALTDTAVRGVVETFSDLARDHGVYVTVSTNVPDYERVEGPVAAVLGDPEADQSYAYEATTAQVFNQNFVFGPDGSLLDQHKKSYLVPLERSRDLGLGMTGIQVDELGLADLPFARLGTVTSKDAWMADVNDRYDQLGAELLVQPEAFDTWGDPGEDLWPPDKFQRSGWLMTQRHPSLRANVTPMLTGNFGDIRFDGQPLIAVEAPGGRAGLCLMGQEPLPGWAAVGRWNALAGPVTELCGVDQRPAFAERAARMAPGSGDELENAYAEDAVFTDLTFPAAPTPAARVPRGVFEVGEPAPADASQLAPAVTSHGDGVALTWVDYRERIAQVVYSASSADGLAWDSAVRVSDQNLREHDNFDNQWAPTLTADGDEVAVAYLDFRDESWDLYRSLSTEGGGWGPSARVDDADELFGTLRERGHSSPGLIRGPDGLVAVWSDLRWPFVNPHVRLARSDDGGQTWGPSARVDGGPLEVDDDQLDGAAGTALPQDAPAAAFTGDGTLHVVWQELTAQGPRIRYATSTGSGETFTAPRWLSGDNPAFRPSLAADGDRVWVAWEERRGAGAAVVTATSADAGTTFTSPAVADPTRPADATQRAAQVIALDGDAVVVFTDDRAGTADALAVSLSSSASGVVRLDDTPEGADVRGLAATALADGRLLAVWHDDRDGVERLRTAVGQLGPVDGVDEEAADPAPRTDLPATGGGVVLGVLLVAAGWAVRSRGRRGCDRVTVAGVGTST